MASITTAEQYFFGTKHQLTTFLEYERKRRQDGRESMRALRKLVREASQLPSSLEKWNIKESELERKQPNIPGHVEESPISHNNLNNNIDKPTKNRQRLSRLYRSQLVVAEDAKEKKDQISLSASLPDSLHITSTDISDMKIEKAFRPDSVRFPRILSADANANSIEGDVIEGGDAMDNAPEADDTRKENEYRPPLQNIDENKNVDIEKEGLVFQITKVDTNHDYSDDYIKDNWVLVAEIQESEKKYENRKRKLIITLAEDDPLKTIDSRLDEIRGMTNPRRYAANVLDTMEPTARDRIMVSYGINLSKYVTRSL